MLAIWPVTAIVIVVLALAAASLAILSYTIAYVSGESLWSKAQKDAVSHLLRYAENGEERHYAAYQREIAVTLGDRAAREALERPSPDLGAAAEGFIQGRNDPRDVPGMIRLFRLFRGAPPIDRAIQLWSEADRQVEIIGALATELRAEVEGARDPAHVARIVRSLLAVNAELAPIEMSFSQTLGDAARDTRKVLLALLLGSTTVLLGVAIKVSRDLLRESQAYESALRESEAILKEAQRLARLGNWSWLRAGDAVLWSEEALHILGCRPDAPGPTRAGHLARVHAEDRSALTETFEDALVHGRVYRAEYRLDGRAGVRWVQERGEPLRDAAGEVIGLRGTIMDIHERKSAEERARQLALRDELTGLANRNLFNQHLASLLAKAERHGRRFAVLFIDLDRFKIINDNLGHDAGDLVLREVAQRLSGCLRGSDTIARLGGDEFVVVVEERPNPRDIAIVAQKIIEAIARPLALGGRQHHLTTSIGISVYPDDGADMQTLCKNADVAMYRAKAQGRNAYEFYLPHMGINLSRNLMLEAGLRRALERGEFLLHYQPKLSLTTGRVTGMEALLRWQHPEQGLIAPGEFIPLAEETGLIVPMGTWALETACRETRAWREAGSRHLRVSVNLSVRQLADRRLADVVLGILEDAGLPPDALELEITESMVMEDARQSLRLLTQLKRRGVHIAMDDFGTGYSSLAYLKRFPIDSLKIDRAFVRDLPGDADACAITGAIVAMARSLRIRVIAEGVETAAQADFLRACGCDEAQGYHFGRPMPAAAFGELLRLTAPPEAPAREKRAAV